MLLNLIRRSKGGMVLSSGIIFGRVEIFFFGGMIDGIMGIF